MSLSKHREKDLNLKTICNALGSIKCKWFELGIHLGIPRNKLKEFKRDEDDPFSAVIDYWLNENMPESADSISWKTLVEALKSDYVGEPGLGTRVSEKYCTFHSEDIPSPCIKEDSHQEDTKKANEDESSSDPTNQMDPSVKLDLEYILEQKLDEILTKYASYVNCLLGIAKQKNLSVEDLCTFILFLPAFSNSYRGKKFPLFKDKEAELKNCKTITEIFTYVFKSCSTFLDYEIFQKIAEKYDIKEDREELHYCDHLKAYIDMHKITEFVKIIPQLKKPMEDSNELILKYDIENSSCLATVVDLKKSVSRILGILPSTLKIISIEEGCVIVKFSISMPIANAIFTSNTTFTLKQEEELRTASVVWLECNGYKFTFEASPVLQKLKEHLTCSVCLGIYNNPKLLQCNHSFCEQCLANLINSDEQQQLIVCCPSCRQVTRVPSGGLPDLTTDFRANQLLEIVRKDCKGVYTTRSSPITATAISSATNLIPYENTVALCPEHEDKEVKLFCFTCMKAICLKCVIRGGSHNMHDCQDFDDVFERSITKNIPSLLTITNEQLTYIEARRTELKLNQDTIMKKIEETVEQGETKDKFISQLNSLTKSKLKCLRTQQDEIEIIELQLNSLEKTHCQKEALDKYTAITRVNTLTTLLIGKVLQVNAVKNVLFSSSAITVRAGDGQVCYGKVFDEDEADYSNECNVGEESTVSLDISNQQFQLSMPNISCELVSEITGKKTACDIKEREKNQYDISYLPTYKGRHQLHLQYGHEHVTLLVNAKLPMGKLGTPLAMIDAVEGPLGVAISNDEVVVTDGERSCISVFHPNRERLRLLSQVSTSKPNGIAIDNKGNMFVTDTKKHFVQKFTADGKLLAQLSIEGDGTTDHYPCGVAFNECNSRVYIAGSHRIHIVEPRLQYHISTFEKQGQDQGLFDNPMHIACDCIGNVYVADYGNNRIQVFTDGGKFLRSFGYYGKENGELNSPYGIAIDNENRVYVSESYNHRISVFTSEGQFITAFGCGGSSLGEFANPRGLAVDNNGIVYACDLYNKRVQIF